MKITWRASALLWSTTLTAQLSGCGSDVNLHSLVSPSQQPPAADKSAPIRPTSDSNPQDAQSDSAIRQGSGSLRLSDATNSYCPVGSRLDSKYWLCIQGSEALGPFPPGMVTACQAAGGGDGTCSSAKWNADFARKLRGDGDCPKGTTLDTKLSQCAADDDVYGPFSTAFVQACMDMTSGSAVCKTQRIHRSFAEAYVGRITPPPPTDGKRLNVPYFYQYANAYEPGSTCNITSVAMVARYWGVNTTPDQIYRLTGGPVYTGDLLVWAGKKVGLTGTFSATGNVKTIKSHLDAGSPVILQGWFTRSGHVMVITGYDSKGWFVNDPAGLWDGCYMCSYGRSTSTNGKGAHYSYASMEKAATDPGNPNSYYITVLKK